MTVLPKYALHVIITYRETQKNTKAGVSTFKPLSTSECVDNTQSIRWTTTKKTNVALLTNLSFKLLLLWYYCSFRLFLRLFNGKSQKEIIFLVVDIRLRYSAISILRVPIVPDSISSESTP
jgi:hypothetical protein